MGSGICHLTAGKLCIRPISDIQTIQNPGIVTSKELNLLKTCLSLREVHKTSIQPFRPRGSFAAVGRSGRLGRTGRKGFVGGNHSTHSDTLFIDVPDEHVIRQRQRTVITLPDAGDYSRCHVKIVERVISDCNAWFQFCKYLSMMFSAFVFRLLFFRQIQKQFLTGRYKKRKEVLHFL